MYTYFVAQSLISIMVSAEFLIFLSPIISESAAPYFEALSQTDEAFCCVLHTYARRRTPLAEGVS
jgi:hypothetical protein